MEKGRVIHLELEAGRALGVHVSPYGVIPKKSKPNKWRLILDLSSPTGHSVNEGIDKETCVGGRGRGKSAEPGKGSDACKDGGKRTATFQFNPMIGTYWV